MFDPSRITAIAQDAMATILLPMQKNIQYLNAREKTPDELVTTADIDSQHFLFKELRSICPNAAFVGEETTEGALGLNELDKHENLWIVDPLDGTVEYAAGRLSFAVMIAFAMNKIVQSAWIVTPKQSVTGEIKISVAYATIGQPAMIDGCILEKVNLPISHRPRGAVGIKFFPSDIRNEISEKTELAGTCRGTTSAGVDMLALRNGEIDYLLYSRTLLWDFAAPLLWGGQAGMFARRLSGAPVRLNREVSGLLCTRSREDWEHIHSATIALTGHKDARHVKISKNDFVMV